MDTAGIVAIGTQMVNNTANTAQAVANYGSQASGLPEWAILIGVIILILVMIKGKVSSVFILIVIGALLFLLFGGLTTVMGSEYSIMTYSDTVNVNLFTLCENTTGDACPSTASCNMTHYYPDNMTFWNYTEMGYFGDGFFNKSLGVVPFAGDHLAKVNCTDGTYRGIKEISFRITSSGTTTAESSSAPQTGYQAVYCGNGLCETVNNENEMTCSEDCKKFEVIITQNQTSPTREEVQQDITTITGQIIAQNSALLGVIVIAAIIGIAYIDSSEERKAKVKSAWEKFKEEL